MVEVADIQVGPEAVVKVSFSAGALNLSASYAGAQAGAQVNVSVSAAALLEALNAALTNPTEKELVAGLEAILKAIP